MGCVISMVELQEEGRVYYRLGYSVIFILKRTISPDFHCNQDFIGFLPVEETGKIKPITSMVLKLV